MKFIASFIYSVRYYNKKLIIEDNYKIKRIEWRYFGTPNLGAILTCHVKGRYFE